MWLLLALLSSVLLGFYDVSKKHALRDNAVVPVLFTATAVGSAPFLVLLGLESLAPGWIGSFDLPIEPFCPLSTLAHAQILGKAIIVGSSWLLAFFALKNLPISIASPIRSSAPAWTLIGAVVLFGERLTLLQFAGVLVVFGSYYALALVGRHERIDFARNRWIGFAMLATLLGAASALYDKYLILRYPPLVMQCWFYVDLVILLGLTTLVGWVPRCHRLAPFRWTATIPCIGLLLAASDLVYFHALAMPGAMISIISVVRRTNVVVAFLVGGVVFQEQNRRQKARAVAGIVAGILLIALSSSRH